jgi:PhnB protein
MPKKKKPSKRKVSPIPKGYNTVTPAMNQNDAKAEIAFCKKVFGAKVRMTMPGPPGKLIHAELEIGDSVVMISDAIQEPARVSSMFLYVPDVDKTVGKALKAGAKVITPVEDMFWGDRMGRIVDPHGNLWTIATHVEEVPAAEMKKRQKQALKQMSAGA